MSDPGDHDERNAQIGVVNAQMLSVAQLKRAIGKEYRSDERPEIASIFNATGTDFDKKVVRLMPLKLEVNDLSDAERLQIKAELERLVALL